MHTSQKKITIYSKKRSGLVLHLGANRPRAAKSSPFSLVAPCPLSDTDLVLLFNRPYIEPVWIVTLCSGSSGISVVEAA